MIRRGCTSWILGLLLLTLVSCNTNPTVVKVTGTVTRHGKAVPNLWLTFEPEQGKPSWGKTDEEGRYALKFFDEGEGALVGSHRVYVTFKPSSPEEEMKILRGEVVQPPEMQAIKKKYGSYETTPLRFDVNESNRVIDIRLD